MLAQIRNKPNHGVTLNLYVSLYLSGTHQTAIAAVTSALGKETTKKKTCMVPFAQETFLCNRFQTSKSSIHSMAQYLDRYKTFSSDSKLIQGNIVHFTSEAFQHKSHSMQI